MTTLPSLQRIYEQHGKDQEFDTKILRKLLTDVEGWTCTTTEWKGKLRDEAVREWRKLTGNALSSTSKKRKKTSKKWQKDGDASDEQGEEEEKPAKKKSKGKEKKTKYDAAAEKNLAIFLGGVGEALVGEFDVGQDNIDGSNDGYDESLQEDYSGVDLVEPNGSSSESGSPSAAAGPSKPKKEKKPPAPKASSSSAPKKQKASTGKRKSSTNSKQIKSAKYVDDTDDSSNELPPSKPIAGGHEKGKGKGKAKARGSSSGVEEEEEEKDDEDAESSKSGEGKGKGKGKEQKEGGKKKKAEPKEGDAAKGTVEEEGKIKKLKSLITAASGPRPFTAQTGAEHTLSVSRRVEILENVLSNVGLPVVGDKLPSIMKAKEVGETREIAKEMGSLTGTVQTSGLRDGKHVHNSSDSDIDPAMLDPRGKGYKKAVIASRKSFGAFLGNQSSNSE